MKLENMLKDGFKSLLNKPMTSNQLMQFMEYKRILLKWNKVLNLTSITDEEEIITKHFLDSISAFSVLKVYNGMKVIDIGTGAGFPGLPLKIAYPEIELTLLDSINKRIVFLEEVCTNLSIDGINFLHMRAEDGGKKPELREKFDICISRAVAPLELLSEFSLPFVRVGGEFIALKGPQAGDEILSAFYAIDVLGGDIIALDEINVPFTDLNHCIIRTKKVRQTPSKYPRKSGKARKKPIK